MGIAGNERAFCLGARAIRSTGVALLLLGGVMAGAVGAQTAGARGAGEPPALLRQAPEASQTATALAEAIRIDDLIAVLVEEELLFGDDLRSDMLPELDPQRWRRLMSGPIDAVQLTPVFLDALNGALPTAPDDLAPLVAVARAPVMAKAIDFELKARQLLLDIDVEDAAFERADAARGSKRYEALADYVAALDLVELSVSGSLNSNLTLYRAMRDGGAFPFDVTEEDMVSDVASEADALRQDIGEWIMAYLYMAYTPLSDAEFSQLVELGTSQAGRDLFRAVDQGYEAVFTHNSKALGGLVAARLAGEDL
ncbi:hypothetical protein [Albirhodobacter sp. R86504]|uniref:hypothetical protein n=1 Tax=Albirhodobacter sp. R86504 TaxID=3093848 RepID=UPI0036733118